MSCKILLFMALLCLAFPGFSAAQTNSGQPLIGPGVQHDMGTIAGMMKEIHLLLHQGHLTPQQNEQISEMMIRLGAVMKEMGGPRSEQMARQHERELKEMRRALETLKSR